MRRKREMQGCLIMVVWDWQWRKDNTVRDKPKTYFITPNRRWCCTYDLNCLYNFCNCKFCYSILILIFLQLNLLQWRSLTVQPNRKHIKGVEDSKTFSFDVKGMIRVFFVPQAADFWEVRQAEKLFIGVSFFRLLFCNHHPANIEFQYIQEFVLALLIFF